MKGTSLRWALPATLAAALALALPAVAAAGNGNGNGPREDVVNVPSTSARRAG